MEDKVSYVALDTCAFIMLADVNTNVSNQKHKIDGFRNLLRDIKKLNESGHLKFVITPTVLSEILHYNPKIDKKMLNKQLDFLQNNCIVYYPEDESDFAMQTYGLANEYIKNKVIDIKNENYFDAYIVAESTILGLNLLTLNGKDLIFYKYETKEQQKEMNRSKDLQKINKKKKYSYTTRSGLFVTPTTHTPESLFDMLRSGEFEGKKNARMIFKERI